MKIPQKTVEDMILEIAGEEGLRVYKVLKGQENVDEFIIAEKLKLTINQLRNLIYKFEKYNLVISTRKKDRKKGWYVYFFTFNSKEAENVVLQLKKEKIKILEAQLNREQAHDFYFCPNKDIRLSLENAMEHNFTCFECGSLMVPEDKEKNIKKIEKIIKEKRDELVALEKN